MKVRYQTKRSGRLMMSLLAIFVLVSSFGAVQAAPQTAENVQQVKAEPKFPMRRRLMFRQRCASWRKPPDRPQRRLLEMKKLQEIRPDRGPVASDRGYSGDGAIQFGNRQQMAASLAIPARWLTSKA